MVVVRLAYVYFYFMFVEGTGAKYKWNIESGGAPAHVKYFPHVAYLNRECSDDIGPFAASCGASILTERIIITCAHCVKDTCAQDMPFKVFVGSSVRGNGTALDIAKFKKHPEYPGKKFCNYDIALLLTKTRIPLSDSVKPVSISKSYTSFKYAVLAGWGENLTSPLGRPHLKYLPVSYIPREICEKKINDTIPKSSFCAGHLTGDFYIAVGDSGSGLMLDKHKLYGMPAGIFGVFHTITVFTNVSHYYNWIIRESIKLYKN